jgi:hypothetical protein
MRASQERISSLCSSIGYNGPDGYVPADHYDVTINELGYSIWHDDEVSRPVATHVYELGVFKRDFLPALLLGGQVGRLALMALTAVTYPPSPNVEDYQKQINILKSYQFEVSLRPEVFPKVLEWVAGIIERPDADETLLQPAELAMTFIRNIIVVPCDPPVHERLFQQLYDALLFDVIEMLRLVRFGDRTRKFARIICGIFYGCFCPYLPLRGKAPIDLHPPEPIDDSDSEERSAPVPPPQSQTAQLASFLEERRAAARGSSRHGHWSPALTFRGKGKGYTLSTPIALQGTASLRPVKRLRIRPRPLDLLPPPPMFSATAEQAATRMLESRVFPEVFEFAFPTTFNGYDNAFPLREQLQLADMTHFFMDFSQKYGPELRVNPLGHPRTIAYFQSMAMFWTEAPTMTLQGITGLTAMQTVCRLIGSMAGYLALIIRDCRRESDIRVASDVVSHTAAEWERILITFLAQKNLTKKPLSMTRDNIVAIERLYKLYSVARENNLVRVRVTQRDEDANPETDGHVDRIEEKLDMFDADIIIARLTKRVDILTPFFILLDHIDQVDDEVIAAMSKMLARFASRRQGLARLFRLPFLYVINKLWQDKTFVRRKSEALDQLNEVFATIVNKLCETARHDRTVLLSIIAGVDPDDVYDEEEARRIQEEALIRRMGLSQEIIDILRQPSQANPDSDHEPSRIIVGSGITADQLPNLPLLRPPPPQRHRPRPPPPPEVEPAVSDSEDDESPDEHMTLDQLRDAYRARRERKQALESE